jgi:hypothetical protein
LQISSYNVQERVKPQNRQDLTRQITPNMLLIAL